MKLAQLLPDPQAVLDLEPDELGLYILRVLGTWPSHLMMWPALGLFIKTELGNPQTPNQGLYPLNQRAALVEAVREAWAWLEGQALLVPDPQYMDRGAGPRVPSRRARQLAKEQAPHRAFSARRIPKEALHPEIREDVWQLFHRGKFDTAVFEAMKAVEAAVRAAAGRTAKDIGAPLMRKAFDAKNGPLTDMAVDDSERESARASICGCNWLLQESSLAPKCRSR
jgi:hypothetical protein